MPNFFDAFKMTACEICGKEVLANGVEMHLNEHGVYEEEIDDEFC